MSVTSPDPSVPKSGVFTATPSERERVGPTSSPTAAEPKDLSAGPCGSLSTVFLHVTKACNLRCEYCYFSASQPLADEMTAEDFARLWPDIVTVHPGKLVLTGGEPLLRPDLMRMLNDLRRADPDHTITRCLNSNGHLVTPELARQLVGLVDEVRVSLDALPERNDALRGEGNFCAAMRAIETYYTVGFEPKVLVTVTTRSLPDLEDLLCLLISRKIDRINVNFFRPIGRGRRHADWVVSTEEVNAATRRAWVRSYPDRPPPDDDDHENDMTCSNCGVGSYLNIMPTGDVFPCHTLTEPEFRCGNVREQSLVEICRLSGLLGDLRALDFHRLGSEAPELEPLKSPHPCMGIVYGRTNSVPAWRKYLPIGLSRKPTRPGPGRAG